MGGTERRLKFRDSSIALAFFSLLFTFHQRKKFVVVVESLLLKYFSVLCLCVRVTSLRPRACVILLFKREINFKQKNDMERVEEQKKGSFLERRKERKE